MTDQTKQVLRKRLQDHVGSHNAITQAQLAEATGINTSTLRSELRRLREERNIPIANQRDGYYVISDRSELQDYVAHINQEIQSKKDTIEHTLEAFESFDTAGAIDVNPEPDVVTPTYECAKCDTEVAKSDVKHPKDGEFNGQPLCPKCYGGLVMDGQA